MALTRGLACRTQTSSSATKTTFPAYSSPFTILKAFSSSVIGITVIVGHLAEPVLYMAIACPNLSDSRSGYFAFNTFILTLTYEMFLSQRGVRKLTLDLTTL